MKKIPTFYILLLPLIYLIVLGFNYSQEQITELNEKTYSEILERAQAPLVINFTDTLVEASGDTVLIRIERHRSQPKALNVMITR